MRHGRGALALAVGEEVGILKWADPLELGLQRVFPLMAEFHPDAGFEFVNQMLRFDFIHHLQVGRRYKRHQRIGLFINIRLIHPAYAANCNFFHFQLGVIGIRLDDFQLDLAPIRRTFRAHERQHYGRFCGVLLLHRLACEYCVLPGIFWHRLRLGRRIETGFHRGGVTFHQLAHELIARFLADLGFGHAFLQAAQQGRQRLDHVLARLSAELGAHTPNQVVHESDRLQPSGRFRPALLIRSSQRLYPFLA